MLRIVLCTLRLEGVLSIFLFSVWFSKNLFSNAIEPPATQWKLKLHFCPARYSCILCVLFYVYSFSRLFLGQVWSYMRTFQLSRYYGGCLWQIRLLSIVLAAVYVSIFRYERNEKKIPEKRVFKWLCMRFHRN